MNIDYSPITINLSVAIRLALQTALLCEVSANLRLVEVEWNDEEQKIFLYFYFDGEISEEDRESAFCITQEASADFDEETKILEQCIRLDYPNPLPLNRLQVYRRRE